MMTITDQFTLLRHAIGEVEQEGWAYFQRSVSDLRRQGQTEEEALRLASQWTRHFIRERAETRIKDMIIEDFVQSMIAEVVGEEGKEKP